MAITSIIGVLITIACLALLASPWPFLAPFAVGGIFSIAALYKNPAWGLIGLAALVPFEGLFKDTSFSGAKIVGFSLILILAVQVIIRKIPEERLHSELWKILGLFIVFIFLSFLFTDYRLLALGNLRELFIGMLFFVITLLVGRDLNLNWLSGCIAVSIAATGVIALFSESHQVGGRAVGLLSDANYFALLVAIGLPAATLMLLHSKSAVTRLFWLAITFILLVGMTKTDSRSGLLVVILCLSIGLWHHKEILRKVRAKHFGFILLGLSIAAPAVLYSLPADYVKRIKSLSVLGSGLNLHEDASIGRRASYLIIGKEMIMEHPLVGAGPGTFPIHYARSGYAVAFSEGYGTPELYRQAHNTYLEITSEMGIPAGILFILLIIAGLKNFKVARQNFINNDEKINADIAVHLGLCFITMAIFMLFLSTPNHKYFWMFLALSSVIRTKSESKPLLEDNTYEKN